MISKTRYKNGLMVSNQSVGLFIWDNGDIFIGELGEGGMHGKGLVILRGHMKLMANFHNNTLQGPQALVVHDRDVIHLTTDQHGHPDSDHPLHRFIHRNNTRITMTMKGNRACKVENIEEEVPVDKDIFKTFLKQIVQKQGGEQGLRLEYIEIDNECYYIGYTEQSVPNGLGVFVFGDDKTHVGFYRQGVLEGFGIIDFENGDKYRGVIRDDKFNGFGYMYN